jgi:UDP-hydrolysing UDP-N-acetyl-D-glucosamine 2-epimerase
MSPSAQITEVLAAIDSRDVPVVFTMPNADPGGRLIWEQIKTFAENHPNVHHVENLGTQAYFSMMATSALMLGNSSSGIVEASSFGLPVVNIGNRQQGRVRGPNVIDVECDQERIAAGIDKALDDTFRQTLEGVPNPHGDGAASDIIVERLRTVELGSRLTTKKFYDGPATLER